MTMVGPTDAICTAVSRNYLPFARVLCASFKRLHPSANCYVVLVDSVGPECRAYEPFDLITVGEIGIPDFESIAFKYDILELNTCIKPSFFRYLFEKKGIERLLYLDPDIRIYNSMDSVFELLSEYSIVLTPHTLKPINDSYLPSEREFLRGGAYNLGFIGLADTAVARECLVWWKDRCLSLGFNDTSNGYFVDQKWVDLVPCFFDDVHVLKDPGCNMAYWNLHERTVCDRDGAYFVNSRWPLKFFHFSGINVESEGQLSKHSNRHSLEVRPDLIPMFEQYRAEVLAQANTAGLSRPYQWGQFTNGTSINKLTRIVYSMVSVEFARSDPFDAEGEYYRFAKSKGLLASSDSAASFSSLTYNPDDWRIALLHRGFRFALRCAGADRYTVLMKYLSFISALRNQAAIFDAKDWCARVRRSPAGSYGESAAGK